MLLGSVLTVILVIAGVASIGPPLERWQSDDVALRVHAQFARLENSIGLLSTDTVKVVTQARAFLKQYHREQVSSSARTHLVATAAKQSYVGHARDRFASHADVMQAAIAYQSSQTVRVNETRERLRALNIPLPATAKLKKKTTSPPTKEQLLQQQQIQKQQQELSGRIAALVVDSAKEAVESRVGDAHVVASLLELEQTIQAHNMRKNSGAFFFYAFVVCLTGGYLWTAVAEKKRRPRQRTQPWSPIPKFMIQIKELLKSVVVRWSKRCLTSVFYICESAFFHFCVRLPVCE